MKNVLPIFIAGLFLFSCTRRSNESAVAVVAGFKTIRILDTSRVYRPGTATTNYLHYRPVDIDVWYPAESSTGDSILLFRDLVTLLEKRANYYTASNAGDEITGQVAQYLCDGLKCSDTTRLLNYTTKTFKGARAVKGKFPLVIYLCAFNGMSFENFTLFEELAKDGYVVACVSSIGRYPGDMTMKNDDIMEQVADAKATLKTLQLNDNINLSSIGIVGYSWGGLAASILASVIGNVGCVVSLDGSEFHHYGAANGENEDFNGIRNSPSFKSMRLAIPYLRLESSPAGNSVKEDSAYNFSEKLPGKKFIFRIDSAQHEDFGCLASVVKKSGNCTSNQYFETISKLTVSFLADNLKKANNFSEAVHNAGARIIQKE